MGRKPNVVGAGTASDPRGSKEFGNGHSDIITGSGGGYSRGIGGGNDWVFSGRFTSQR